MKTIVKHNNGTIYGTERYIDGVDYSSIPDTVIIDKEYSLNLNKICTIDLNTLEITEVDKPINPKILKQRAIDNIFVTTQAGNVFNGDEVAQRRMVMSIQLSNITGQTTTNWKLADNSIIEVTVDELKEALLLSGQALSTIILNY